MRIWLTVVAFVGIVLGKTYLALFEGMALSARKGHTDHGTGVSALQMMGQQNMVLIQGLIEANKSIMKELVFEAVDKDDEKSHEISCKTEHIDVVRAMMDNDAESIVREVASWAHGVLGQYDLKLRSVSLEPEMSSDPGMRTNDIALIFHVTGIGDDALRFQAEASRKLREIVQSSEANSGSILRTDVRWN
jgi:hypothetical protein